MPAACLLSPRCTVRLYSAAMIRPTSRSHAPCRLLKATLSGFGYWGRRARMSGVEKFVDVKGASDGPYACPCCGFITLAERSGY